MAQRRQIPGRRVLLALTALVILSVVGMVLWARALPLMPNAVPPNAKPIDGLLR